MRRRRRQQSRSSPYADEDDAIDIIPLIDVIFLLLCFFIFLTLAMVVQEGIAVDLAKATTGESVERERKPLVVSVDQDGKIYLDEEQVTEDELPARLRAHARRNPDRPVHLNADEGAQHGRVITALDAVRQSDLTNLVLTIKPREPSTR